MPVHDTDEEKTVKDKKIEDKKSLSPTRVTLMFGLGFVYFAASTGLEGFFSSQIFTFGLCGPHALPPKTVRGFFLRRNIVNHLILVCAASHSSLYQLSCGKVSV